MSHLFSNLRKLIVYTAFILVFALTITPRKAKARSSVQLSLARLCVSEAGFQITRPMSEYTNDCAAIVAALRNRSRTGTVTDAILRAYTRRLFHGRTRMVRQWVSFLHVKHSRPPHWPTNLSWERHQPRFVEIYNLVGRLLRHDVEPPCLPDHWGARWRFIQDRAHRQGWHRVDCGPTFNEFWRIH